MTEEINKGCEFQSDCIEYKDISYLKIMPICAIHELSIACHDKVNKCKYYTLYKQLQKVKQENEQSKACLNEIKAIIKNFAKENILTLPDLTKEQNYKFIAEQYAKPIKEIINKISEVENDTSLD